MGRIVPPLSRSRRSARSCRLLPLRVTRAMSALRYPKRIAEAFFSSSSATGYSARHAVVVWCADHLVELVHEALDFVLAFDVHVRGAAGLVFDPHRQYRRLSQAEYVLVGDVIADIHTPIAAAMREQGHHGVALMRRAWRQEIDDKLAMDDHRTWIEPRDTLQNEASRPRGVLGMAIVE